MSSRHSVDVICSKCHNIQTVIVHDSVRISLFSGHKEKEAISKLKFYTHTCSFCGNEIKLAYPSLYHDTKKKLMIWLLPVGIPNEQKLLDDILKTNVPDGYTTRIVSSAIELADKIEIFDADLDDRVVEICKILIYGDLCKEDTKYDEYDVRHITYHKNHGTQHAIMYHYECRGRQASFAVAMQEDYYRDIAKAFNPAIDKMPCRNYEEVNTNWAYAAIKMYKDKN